MSLYSTVENQREREKPRDRKYMTDTNLQRTMTLVRSLKYHNYRTFAKTKGFLKSFTKLMCPLAANDVLMDTSDNRDKLKCQ
jgi:hypothetical protein